MAYFFGFAFIVHLVQAIGRAMIQDRSAVHRREVQRVVGFWSFVWLVLRTWVAKLLHWLAVDYRRRSRTSATARLQPFGVANPDQPSHLAVFVRGTFGGDGNGTFCTGACTSTSAKYNVTPGAPVSGMPETQLFWMHLRLSGFVPGATSGASSVQQPSNAVNGMLGVQTTGMGFTSNIICTSNLPDKVAIAVDTQVDDGVSATGGVRGQLQTAPSPDVGTAATGYSETGTNQYLLCKNL